jgi:hypothetical protein
MQKNLYVMKQLFAFVLVVSIVIVGCKKENSSPASVDLGYDYFPVDSGIERVYKIDSIYWDAFNAGLQDSVSYEVKDICTGTFLDAQGRLTYRIERFKKDATSNTWNIWKVYSENVTSTTAERTYDNVRFVKLAFAAKLGTKWNGNSFNTLDAQDYEIISTGDDVILAGQNFSDVLTVLQKEDFNAINQTYAEEKYSKGIGMIFRRDKNINTTFGTIITGGYDYTETLISYANIP